jgi:hypothetical protein
VAGFSLFLPQKLKLKNVQKLKLNHQPKGWWFFTMRLVAQDLN